MRVALYQCPPLPLDVDVTFDFGENFHVEERGLDAFLSGLLRVRTEIQQARSSNQKWGPIHDYKQSHRSVTTR